MYQTLQHYKSRRSIDCLDGAMEAASISVGDTFYRGTKVEENGKHDDADVDVDDEDGAEVAVAIGHMHSLHMEVEV